MTQHFETQHWAGQEWQVEITNDSDVIYCVDMTPCDDMHNYKEIDGMPEFVKEDTPLFDKEDAHTVIQVATLYGWAVVAKWYNNGSTRIYGLKPEVVMDAVAILSGPCDSGACDVAYGEYIINYKYIHSKADRSVFSGISLMYAMAKESMTQQQAKQKLFEALDAAFCKYGAAAGMSNPGYHPHYSEVGAENMRPSWYTQYKLTDTLTLYTTYESIDDLCLSVLMKGRNPIESHYHTGYPQNLEQAQDLAETLFKKYKDALQ